MHNPRAITYIDNLHIYTQIIPHSRIYTKGNDNAIYSMLVAVPLLHMTERTLCFQC